MFRRKKLSDAADNEGPEDDAFDDETRGLDAERLEEQNAETLSTPELVMAGESKDPVTSSDRESSPAEGLTRPRSSSKLSRKSRRTLRVDAIEDHHSHHEETEKKPHFHSQSKRDGFNSHATPSVPTESEKVNEEDEGFGFDIEISVPAEPAREVLRRSSSRERGRRSRSSSREAMRKVRERSRQRRTERATKENPDSSHDSGDGMASSLHSAINQGTSNENANSQDGTKTSEKKSQSPRPGTRSRSSERPFASKRESTTTGHEVRTDVGKSLEVSQDQAIDGAKSTPSSLNRPRGSNREGRRPRREKESTEEVILHSNDKDATTASSGLSAGAGVDERLRHENVESAKASKQDSRQIEKRSQYRSSSRDIMRSKHSDSKERTRRSRADSKERPMSTRSSSKDGRGHGRSRSKEGLSSRVLKCYAEKEGEETGKVQRRHSTEEISSLNEEKSPMNKSIPRRNSREDIGNLKSHHSTTEDHEIRTRIPRRNSREDAIRQQTLERTEVKHESTSQEETHNGRSAMHQQTNHESDGSAPKHKSIMHMVRPNSQGEEESPSKQSQLTAEEMPHKSGSPSREVRQRSRERRSRRPRVQSSDEKTEMVPNVETSLHDNSGLLKNVDKERKEKEMQESVEMFSPRALPNVIIHEEVERQQLEARKGFGHVERHTEVSPAMALLDHLGSGDTVVPANQLHIEELPTFTAEVVDTQSVNILDDIKEEVPDLQKRGNESMIEPASQQNETLKSAETKEETRVDSARGEMQPSAVGTSIDLAIQQNVEETIAEEFDGTGKAESLSTSTTKRNTRKDMTRTKRKSTTGVKGDPSKDSNPANDLLGFLGSNYDDLFTKNEESSTPNASDPFSVDQPENSIDFFQAINFTGFEHQSGGDDYDRIERLVDSLDKDAFKDEGRPLPPPSVAPVDESAKQKARLARRLARQKKPAVDNDDDGAPSTLCPPSLAGDMPKLMQKSSVRKPKKEASEPSARGVSRCHSDESSTLMSMLNDQERPSTKSTSGSRPKIRRAKSGDNFGDHVCEQSLAPPSLAPPSLAPRRMAPKTPEKEEEMPRKVTRREVRKATKFASLDEDDDDEDSVGIIVATTSPADVPKRKGVLSKAQSAVNILEKTTRRVVKKAASTKNLFA